MMSQVLGTFGILDFTMLWPVLAWRAFQNHLSLILQFSFSGRSKLRVTETVDTESADMGA
jgi:hypothetical protein